MKKIVIAQMTKNFYFFSIDYTPSISQPLRPEVVVVPFLMTK